MKLDKCVTELALSNVLLLGISYPCVRSQMESNGQDPNVLTHKEPSVEQAVECVRRNILTEMDARDLARCVAVEQSTNTRVYTVSREIGAVYNDRHINCDFNTRNFCKKITDQFGEGIQFSQVILDYYWMPTGWLVTRWAKTLFQQTLPDLVRHQMLAFPSKRKKTSKHGSGPPYAFEEGVVFLPFCAHVCKELVGAIHILEQYYEISFLDKKDLHGHSLWKGTMEIDPDVMQHRLGKRLDQEEIYCKFRPKDIYESMEDPHVSKPAVMRVLLAIKNYDDVRMVRLRPLRQHERASVFRERMWAPEVGGFMGLDFELSARLLKEQKKKGRKRITQLAIEEEKKEDEVLPVTKQGGKLQSNGQKKIGAIKAVITTALVPKKSLKVATHKAHDHDDEEDDCEADERYQFYPGPVRDLETYNETTKVISQDMDELAAFRVKQRRKNQKEKLLKGRTGIIRLFGDGSKAASKSRKIAGFSPLKIHDYLSFNPRAPGGGTNNVEAEKEWELDWSIIAEEELQFFLENCAESDDESSAAKVEVDPLLADDMDLKAASNLFHRILRGFDTPNKRVDGLERVTRFRVNEESFKEETVDQSSDSESKYKEFASREVDSPVGEQRGEVCNILSKCIQRRWERILFTVDFDWISTTSSEWPIRSIQLTTTDETEYQVKINRMTNLRMILHWLLCGQENDEDGGDCFRAILHDLSVRTLDVADKPTAELAVAIEEDLLARIFDITDQLRWNRTDMNPEGSSIRNILQTILYRLPKLSVGEAAATMLMLNHEREDFQTRRPLVQTVTTDAIDQDDNVLDRVEMMSHGISDALTLLHLQTRIDATRLVWESERGLVPDLLFLTLQQFTIDVLTEADRVRLGERVKLGARGMACRHCSVGLACNATWRLLPNPQKPFLHQDTLWRTMISHIVGCDWCPSVIKCEINQLLDEYLDSDGKFLVRDVLEKAESFLLKLQRRVDDSSLDVTAGAKEATFSTKPLPCRGLAIDIRHVKPKKKLKSRLQQKSITISASDDMPNVALEAASIMMSLASNEVTLTIEEQQSTALRLVQEHTLPPTEGPGTDAEAMIPAESPLEKTTRPDRRTPSVASCKRLQMDSLSRISLETSTLNDNLVRKNQDPPIRRSLRQTARTPSVLEGAPKSFPGREMSGSNPSHEGRSDRKRQSCPPAVGSDDDTSRASAVRKKSKTDDPPALASSMNGKTATPVSASSSTERNTNDRTVDVLGEAERHEMHPTCRSTFTDPSQGSSHAFAPLRLTIDSNHETQISHACGEPRRKSPVKFRDPSELPHLAAHSAKTPSTKKADSRPASSKSESPRKLRKTISRLPVGSPRTHVGYDSLVRVAPEVSFGSLHERFPYPFALSRKDPADRALKTFLGMTNLSLEGYVNWIFKLSEYDDVAVLHRICLWRGSYGRIFESMEESRLFESICSDLPSPGDDSQSVIGHVHAIKTMFVIRNSQGNTMGTSDPLFRPDHVELDGTGDGTTANPKYLDTTVPPAPQGFRPVSPRVPFPPSAAWQCQEGLHANLPLLTNEEVIEARGATTIPLSNQHLP